MEAIRDKNARMVPRLYFYHSLLSPFACGDMVFCISFDRNGFYLCFVYVTHVRMAVMGDFLGGEGARKPGSFG
jgi:hypothetical protein